MSLPPPWTPCANALTIADKHKDGARTKAALRSNTLRMRRILMGKCIKIELPKTQKERLPRFTCVPPSSDHANSIGSPLIFHKNTLVS